MMLKLALLLALALFCVSVQGCAQFRDTNPSVAESDGSLEVCVQFTAAATAGSFIINTNANLEADAPDDFSSLAQQFTIQDGHTDDICVTIQIEEDNILEDRELFDIIIITSDVDLCTLGTTSRVSIADSTRLPVSFTMSNFASDNEQGIIDVCINVPISSYVFDRPVTFNFAIVPGAGTASTFDIIAVTSTVKVIDESLSEPTICLRPSILEDSRVESDEYIEMTITSSDSIDLVGGNARVTITDDDGAVLFLTQEFVTVDETDSGFLNVPLCISLNSSNILDRDVNLLLNTNPPSSPDYIELNNFVLTIPAGSRQGDITCTNVLVVGDRIREDPQEFAVAITAVDADDDIRTRTFRVRIISEETDSISDCGPLPNPQNGNVTFENTIQGSIASYSCNEGFTLSSTSIRVCLNTALWSGSEPDCNILDCGAPPSTQDGTVTFATTTFGSVATYSCDVGFMLDAGGEEFNRSCVVANDGSGVWSLDTPTCSPINCEALTDPQGGRVTVTSTNFGATAEYSCQNGFLLSSGGDTLVRTCESDAMWSPAEPTCDVINCGQLFAPLNGTITLNATTFGSTAMYTCDEGHDLIGGNVRVCQDQGWSGDEPVCEVIDCGGLSDPANGTVVHPGTTFGFIATYTCEEGFSLTGQRERMCTILGWSGEDPQCFNIVCDLLTVPANGNIAISGRSLDSTALYTCTEGHFLSTGDETFTRTCGEDSQWSPMTEPTCDPAGCGIPPDVMNGTIDLSDGTVFGSEIEYSCDDSLTLVGLGGNARLCQADGKWNATDPTCEDLGLTIDTLASSGERILEGMAVSLNCTAMGIPESLTAFVEIAWEIENGEVLLSTNESLFLVLELDPLMSSDAGRYICRIEIKSTLLPGNVSTETADFTLFVTSTTQAPPLVSDPDNSSLIIGVVVGGGTGLFLLIFCIGALLTCYLCLKRKKNYRKYVLPYRTYMDAYRNTGETIENPGATPSKTPANDIRQWENGRREHVLDAVDMLDMNKRNGASK